MIYFLETQKKYYEVEGTLGDYEVTGECFYGSTETDLEDPELILTHRVTGEQIHIVPLQSQVGRLVIDPAY